MKTNKVIIVGNSQTAELGLWYLQNDSEYQVVGFSVDGQYIKEDKFNNLPIFSYEDLETEFNSSEYNLFAPLYAKHMNKIRENIFLRGKQKGYNFISYKSSKATILTENIGENCFILENNTIQPYTSIGNNVVIWSGNHIGHHTQVQDHVYITSHVVVSGGCIIGKNSFLGVNSCIKDGTVIGDNSLIGMGAIITKNTEINGAYISTPTISHKIKADRFL
jgi:sugar O-acyltransferase (sialic acid O-acetyltransferase NeuD family)